MGGQRSLGLSFIPLRLGYPSLSVHTPLSFCVHPHYCTRRPVALLMQPMPPTIHRTAAHKYSSAPSHPYARKIWPSREGITTAFLPRKPRKPLRLLPSHLQADAP